MADNLVESLIKRNEEDMERINLLTKSLDKLKSKEVAGKIQNLLIEEVMKLVDMNKQLKEYLISTNSEVNSQQTKTLTQTHTKLSDESSERGEGCEDKPADNIHTEIKKELDKDYE